MKTLFNLHSFTKSVFSKLVILTLVIGLTSCGKNNHLETDPNQNNNSYSNPYGYGGNFNGPNGTSIQQNGERFIYNLDQGQITNQLSRPYTGKTNNGSIVEVRFCLDNTGRRVGAKIKADLNFSNLSAYSANNHGNPHQQVGISLVNSDLRVHGTLEERSQIVTTLTLRYSNNVTLPFYFHSY